MPTVPSTKDDDDYEDTATVSDASTSSSDSEDGPEEEEEAPFGRPFGRPRARMLDGPAYVKSVAPGRAARAGGDAASIGVLAGEAAGDPTSAEGRTSGARTQPSRYDAAPAVCFTREPALPREPAVRTA